MNRFRVGEVVCVIASYGTCFPIVEKVDNKFIPRTNDSVKWIKEGLPLFAPCSAQTPWFGYVCGQDENFLFILLFTSGRPYLVSIMKNGSSLYKVIDPDSMLLERGSGSQETLAGLLQRMAEWPEDS